MFYSNKRGYYPIIGFVNTSLGSMTCPGSMGMLSAAYTAPL
jgi:hypothetical protein